MTPNGHSQPTTMASQSAIATFFPGYFALVMATGIISLAAYFLGLTHIAQVLFWVNMYGLCRALGPHLAPPGLLSGTTHR